jgi:hypothetical protein
VKKNILLIAILVIVIPVAAQSTQEKVEAISLSYFGINAFGKTPDSIESDLIKARNVSVDFKRAKSDSTLFFFSGYTKNFNPFSFSPDKVQYELVSWVNKQPSSEVTDTLLAFYIIALTDSSETGKQKVINEYKKLDKEFKMLFSRKVYQHKKNKKVWLYQQSNYYEGFRLYPELTVGWGVHYSDQKTYTLSIFYNMKLK